VKSPNKRSEEYYISQYEEAEKQARRRSPRALAGTALFLVSMLYFYAFHGFYLYMNIVPIAAIAQCVLISLLLGVSLHLIIFALILFRKYLYGQRLPNSYYEKKLIEKNSVTQIDVLESKANLLSKRLKSKVLFITSSLILSFLIAIIEGTIALLNNTALSALNIGIFIGIVISVGCMTYLILYAKTASNLEQLKCDIDQQTKRDWHGINISIIGDSQVASSITPKADEPSRDNLPIKEEKSEENAAYSIDRNLEDYYKQTQVQAERSFWACLIFGIGGGLVVFFGVALLFASKISPGIMTTVAGILGEFIAAAFLNFYNNTTKSMSKYHNKLVLSQNIVTALKAANTISEPKRSEVCADLSMQLVKDVNALITAEGK